MDEAAHVTVLARVDRHLEHVDCEGAAQRGRDLPDNDHPAEHVDDEGGVDPAGVGLHIGQVGDPVPVRRGGAELALDKVIRAGQGLIAERRHLELPAPPGRGEAHLPQQARTVQLATSTPSRCSCFQTFSWP